ncbi:EamA domain, WAT1-related protein [Tanacetum coccineum]
MSTTSSKVVWLGNMLHSLGLRNLYPVELFCDNSLAIQIVANPVFHERTKHIELDVHFVREKCLGDCVARIMTATIKEYPDQQTIVFFYCVFGMLQCIALSPFLEPKTSAWVVQPGIGMTAILYGEVYSTIIHNTAITWCLEKKGLVFVVMFAPLQIVFAIILGVTFRGDSLHLRSAIGATIIAVGFYTVMWGQVKEKNKLVMDLITLEENGSSNPNTSLLSSSNESKSFSSELLDSVSGLMCCRVGIKAMVILLNPSPSGLYPLTA